MMKRKRALLYLFVALALVGAGLTMTPFALSLNPSERADASLPRINVSTLKEGTYRLVKHPTFPEFHSGIVWSILLLKRSDGEIRAWIIPTRGTTVLMPDLHWWRPMFECEKFGPTMTNGVVNETAPIQCHDDSVPEWWSDKWLWSIEGGNYSGQVDDMEPAKGSVENGFFVGGKSSQQSRELGLKLPRNN